jgi:hypothetical protein
MAEITLDTMWRWWRELAKREIDLERKYNPLIEEHAAVHGKRMALENLMAQGQVDKITPQIKSEWDKLRKGQELPSTQRKPADVAYDVLSRQGKAMHYRTILDEVRAEGSVVVGGRDPGTTLVAYLGRDKRFSKVRAAGRGFWGLKEWVK